MLLNKDSDIVIMGGGPAEPEEAATKPQRYNAAADTSECSLGNKGTALVGLGLLLVPAAASHVITRTVGAAVELYPVLASSKVLQSKQRHREHKKWLTYWSVYGCVLFAERLSGRLLYCIPFYAQARLLFLLWLQLPYFDVMAWSPVHAFLWTDALLAVPPLIKDMQGAQVVFDSVITPLLSQHMAQIEAVLSFGQKELDDLLRRYSKELATISTALSSLLATGMQKVQDWVNGP
eukprot:jgi/Chlat1/3971/Chrsp26S04214